MKDRLQPVMHEVDLLLAELREAVSLGPRFRIVHRFRERGVICLPGEEIAMISLIHRGKEYGLGFPLSLRILFDYLARYRRVPQNAAQIEAGMRTGTFYLRHGANAGKKQIRKFSRSAVKEYVRRIRIVLGQAFKEAHLSIDPNKVLISGDTVGKEVLYKLRASFQWVHHDLGSE